MDQWRFPAIYPVVQHGPLDESGNVHRLLHRHGGLDEYHIRTRLEVAIAPLDRILESIDRNGIRTCKEQKPIGFASIDEGLDLRHERLRRYHAFARHVATL